MVAQHDTPADELVRLRACVAGVVGIMNLPTPPASSTPAEMLSALLDALVQALGLAFACASSTDPDTLARIEVVRHRGSFAGTIPTTAIALAIASSGADAPHEPVAIGERKLFLASAQLGFDGELGVIVAASDSPDFPGQTERALLDVAANRATLSLQQAQRQLRPARRDDRPMIDAIPGAAWCTRADGSLELINQPWLDYTGLTLEQAINWGWTVAFHPDEVLDVQRIWQQFRASGTEGEVELRLRRHDGVYRWFLIRVRPFRDESGQIVRWYGTNTDIDDLKRAQDELRRNEALLAEGQRVSATGSFLWRLETDEITFSQELYRIFALDLDTPLTIETIVGRVHPDDIPLVAGKIELARRGIVDHEYDVRLRMPDGAIRYIRTSSHPRRDREGGRELIGVMQDITDRRHAEDALSRVRSELAHMTRVASLGALTASIAHEVNQPLSGIAINANACLRMLAAEPPDIEGAIQTVRRTLRDGNRAADVVVRLRALFAKKGSVTAPLDLNEATREVLSLSLSELQRNRVVLCSELADGLPRVMGDRIQLQQVILNLLLNASEAMTGIQDRPRRLVVRTERDQGDRARLTVQDVGVGLQPQDTDKPFQPFYTTKESGMGVGLSVSRSIVESHGGRLWAAPNSEGPGASFSFSIPLVSASSS